MLWLVMGTCLLGAAGVAEAQTSESLGLTLGHRLVHRFDFEEARYHNYENLPMHWFVIGREADTANPVFNRQPLHQELTGKVGFPAYTSVGFDRPQQEEGPHSLLMNLNGGSAGVFLEVGALPAVPGSDYLVACSVRTQGMKRAGAKMIAYLVDAEGRRIDGSVVQTALARTDGQWTTLAVKLRGEYSEAAWLGIELQAKQPSPPQESVLGKHQIVLQDVQGRAWFDNLQVWQLPHVTVRAQNAMNVVKAPERPQLQIEVRDFTGGQLRTEAKLFDFEHRLVDQDTQWVGQSAPKSWTWRPQVNLFGWYLLDLRITETPEGAPVPRTIARILTAFLWLGSDDPMSPSYARKFLLTTGPLGRRELELLAQLLEATDLGAVSVSVWQPTTIQGELENRTVLLDDLVQALSAQKRQVLLNLAPLPLELAHQMDIDSHNPMELFAHQDNSWQTYLAPALMRLGQRVHYWQLGALDQAAQLPQLDQAKLAQTVHDELRDLAPQPRSVLPWRLQWPAGPTASPSTVHAVDVPVWASPEMIPQYLEDWKGRDYNDLWLHLSYPPATEFSNARRVEDLALRMIYAWTAQPDKLAMNQPWDTIRDRGLLLVPDPLLGVFSTVAHRLAGRQLQGRLPIAPGVECMIFDGPRGGMLVAWNRSAPPNQAVIDMYLGDHPSKVDVWGNRTPLTLTNGRHRVELGSIPTFIEGIDPRLALLHASFVIDPRLIVSSALPQKHRIRFTNPWPQTMTGKLMLSQPKGWTLFPPVNHFTVGPGQSVDLPVTIQFPIYEIAEDKQLVANFEFNTDRPYSVRATTGVELGLPDIDVDASLTLEPNPAGGGRDIVVTQLITYKGESPQSFYVYANVPGFPRQERLIPQLLPGQSVVRKFRFPNAVEKLGSRDVRVGVREANGPAMLNRILSLSGP